MEATLLLLAKLLGAALVGAGILKGSEVGYKKFRASKEELPNVSPVVCQLKHQAIDDNIQNLKEDIGEVKQSILKIAEVSTEIIKLSGKLDLIKEEIKSEIHDAVDKHIDKYHNAA